MNTAPYDWADAEDNFLAATTDVTHVNLFDYDIPHPHEEPADWVLAGMLARMYPSDRSQDQ